MNRMETMKVAIVYGVDSYNESYGEFIPQNMGEWVEVTKSEYHLLADNLHMLIPPSSHMSARLLVQPVNQHNTVTELLLDAKKALVKIQESRDRIDKEKEEKRIKRALSKQAQTEAEERKLLETLKDKYDNP